MTRNEAINLPRCLSSLDRFAQCFVVDSGSDDGTPDIARCHGARLVPFQWNGRYPKKKQWCLDSLPFDHDWVLFVDADERPTAELVEEIARLMVKAANEPCHAAYWIDGRPVIRGQRLRFGCWNRKLALVDRRYVRFPEPADLDIASMWEVEGHYQPRVHGTTGRLRHPMDHEDAKPPSAWFDRHNHYSDWEAALRADGRMERLIDGEPEGDSGLRRCRLIGRRAQKRLFQRLPGRPLWAFLHAYILRLGALDGIAGLDHALGRAFYYWQVGLKMRSAASTPAPAAAAQVPSARTVPDFFPTCLPGGEPYSSSIAILSPPSAFNRSNVRLRTPGSSIR
ncbi:glycosyltransferase family 2 protein [Azospirillum sp. B506]|uniref:glycosyltransferase family 2 protein n=1 Tax=Azospirillum sp. B506 TaxID=137721 RepID=UPI001FCBDA54|nr:glycosyltransferase family 2 protein [Azospirillum sp. B506]